MVAWQRGWFFASALSMPRINSFRRRMTFLGQHGVSAVGKPFVTRIASVFFSEEKNQKTFASYPPLPRSRPWPACLRWHRNKSLLLLFFRKADLPFTSLVPDRKRMPADSAQ
jgi:hypothetical protein